MSYGEMRSFDTVIEWLEKVLPETDMKMYSLNRLRYERDMSVPIPVKLHKGIYGKKFDSYTCGNCGRGVAVVDCFCPGCGRRIDWSRK